MKFSFLFSGKEILSNFYYSKSPPLPVIFFLLRVGRSYAMSKEKRATAKAPITINFAT